MTHRKPGGYGWDREINRAMRANDRARAAVRRILDEKPGPGGMALMLTEIALCLGEERVAMEAVNKIQSETDKAEDGE